MEEGLLLPEPDEDSAPFWEGTRAGELRMQACAACGRLRFPPRPMCPHCHSLESAWRPVSGRGTVWSFVVPHPPLLPAYSRLAPYNVVVVALEEDPTLRLVGNLVASAGGEPNQVDPATIKIGMPVRVVFCPVAEDVVLPRWVRA
ncbi:MAG TPA: Zn-ribbon domain-containing OB-fold protein [Acidimicrobiales bacterium]|nr:Zn-ribbon domain-containing OB-fold protein [Acidimicrobiales bacterium]